MMRPWVCIGLITLLALGLACAKKKAEGPGTGEAAAEGDVGKFDEGCAGFREAIRFTSLTPDKVKGAEAAGQAEAAFDEVKRAWPEEPPKAFEGDNDWENRISALTKIMADIKNQLEADRLEEAKASILEAQKLILALHEKNNVNTAGDEAIRLLVLVKDMDLALSEKRYNDMKHIMPNMREAQKNFFGSAVPPSAAGREDEFDDIKDKVYDGVDEFAEAALYEGQQAALDGLVRALTEFYVEFG
jgi:hypothetical protein